VSSKLILKLLLSLSFALPVDAVAFEKKCDPKDEKKCSIYLPKDQAAPFTGVLLTPRLAATQAVRASSCKDELSLAVQKAQELASIRKAADAEIYNIDLTAKNKEIKLLEQAVQEALPSWHEKPIFIVPVTVVLTLAVIGASVAIASELRGTTVSQ